MKSKTIVIPFLFLLLFVGCQTQNKAFTGKRKNDCHIQNFQPTDSSGVFTGKIVRWENANAMVPYGGLWLTGNANDTVIMRVDPQQTANFIEGNLHVGNCIVVSYYTEVIKEGEIEINRFFYATRLVYPIKSQ